MHLPTLTTVPVATTLITLDALHTPTAVCTKHSIIGTSLDETNYDAVSDLHSVLIGSISLLLAFVSILVALMVARHALKQKCCCSQQRDIEAQEERENLELEEPMKVASATPVCVAADGGEGSGGSHDEDHQATWDD